jgi:addiction module RelB/DinJ family antitoxin
MNTTINVRIDSKTKKSAKKVLDGLGFDISSAVKVFLEKVISVRGIPFVIHEGGLMNDPKFIARIQKETEWAKKHGKKYASVEALFADLNK